jgi:hypothetical protein
VSSPTPKKKKSGSNEKQFVVIAVPVVEEASLLLLATGLFEVCPGSDNSVIDKKNGVQVRLITIGSRN